MTSCPQRERLLELEPEALASPDAEWAEHLERCAECTSAVERILSLNDGLAQLLSAHPPIDAAEIVRRARISTDSAHPKAATRSRTGTWGGVALVAAAAVALLILVRTPPPQSALDGAVSAESVVPERAEVYPVVVSDVDAAILPTANPEITVVWFFTGE